MSIQCAAGFSALSASWYECQHREEAALCSLAKDQGEEDQQGDDLRCGLADVNLRAVSKDLTEQQARIASLNGLGTELSYLHVAVPLVVEPRSDTNCHVLLLIWSQV